MVSATPFQFEMGVNSVTGSNSLTGSNSVTGSSNGGCHEELARNAAFAVRYSRHGASQNLRWFGGGGPRGCERISSVNVSGQAIV
jgi:hypothetical protein